MPTKIPKRRRGPPVQEEEPAPALPAPGVWPADVPILSEKHLCRRMWESSSGCRDLGGWLDVAFDCSHSAGASGNPLQARAYDTLLEILVEEGVDPDLALWQVCDDESYELALLAVCWNRAMKRLGYEIPEACL